MRRCSGRMAKVGSFVPSGRYARAASVRCIWQGRDGKLAVSDVPSQKIHGGRSDKAGNKTIVGITIKVERGTNLFDSTIAQHDNLIRQCHGFDLIMRHIDHGRAKLLVQRCDFHAHVDPQFGIQIRQRFVEQEHLLARARWCARCDTWRCPPESALGLRSSSGSSLRMRAASATFAVISSLERHSFLGQSPYSRPRSYADKAAYVWNTMATPRCDGSSLVTSRAPMVIWPAVVSSSPATMRISVDLPQPEGPTKTQNSPSSIWRSIPWMT